MAHPRFLSSIPPITLRLMIATSVVTIGAVVANNFGLPQVLQALSYQAVEVVPGLKVWKLLTYVFVTGLDPISFLFDLLVLYFFAGWFERSFGPRRFLRFFLLSAAGAALLPLALSPFSVSVATYPYLGAWSVFEALTVAMGMLQPGAQVYFYMVLPVTARQLMFLSWGLIALFIVFFHGVVPYLTAIGGIGMGFALTLGSREPRRWWLRFQAARLERQLKRRAQHLRVIPKNGEDKNDKYLH
jgi:membrane associated rhomboid family serine protease